MQNRYAAIYSECAATSKQYWGTELGSAASILELWELELRNKQSLAHNQEFYILDRKTDKTMSEDEFLDIVKRLKGWG